MNGILLLLGSNLGDRLENLNEAKRLLSLSRISSLKESSVYESEPWGIADQPWFLNQVIEVTTSSTPEELLQICLDVETEMGRKREIKWGERLIDIDILVFNQQTIKTKSLGIPHPEIPNRRFTLIPICEHWESWEFKPNRNFRSLLSDCKDDLQVRRLETL